MKVFSSQSHTSTGEIMMSRSSFPTIIALALLGSAWAPVTMAQRSQAQVEQSAPGYSDAELKSFAVAVLQVQRINDAYLPRLQSAKTPEEQQQVKEAASGEMVRAVEKEGISVDKYKEIMTQAQTNPEVAERIKQHIKDVQ
jgi:hypothetical protein